MYEIGTKISEVRLEMAKLEMAIEKLKIEHETRLNMLQHETLEAYKRLAVAISLWEEKYTIRSPISGRVSFVNFWSSNQNVKVGEVILVVVPDKEFDIIGKMSIPPKNSGKIREGQKVFIRLNNYPYEEFGSLLGKVNSISLAPIDNVYLVEAHFSEKQFTTTYGRKIIFQDGLSGTAEIILQESSLATRIFNIILGRTNKYSE